MCEEDQSKAKIVSLMRTQRMKKWAVDGILLPFLPFQTVPSMRGLRGRGKA